MRTRWLIGVGIVIVVIAIWQLSRFTREVSQRAQDGVPASEPSASEGSAARSAPTPPSLAAPGSRATSPGAGAPGGSVGSVATGAFDRPFDARTGHLANPCTAVGPPAIPPGYDSVVEAGITVAWARRTSAPDEAPWRPLAVAHLVAGLLEEAARLTGSARREELTIVVDPSAQAFKARTHAPGWAAGLYDGAVVHVHLRAGADLAVNLATLRHEVMHAQLHVAVGCGPFWFHEGVATYFAGAPPLGELLAMLRDREVYELAALRDPVLLEQADGQAGKAYAMSLAMVLYLVDAGGDRAIADLVRTATTAAGRQDALGLWPRVAPAIDERAVLDALARRVFGLSLGSELEAALTGPVCCRGVRDVDDLRCRRPEVIVANKSQWLDGNTLCRTSW